MVSPERKRAAVRHLQAAGMCSERRACALVGLSRSSLSYKPRVRADESALRADIRELAQKKRRYGYRRIWWELRQLGWFVNYKRVYRLWRMEGLCLPRKRPRRRRRGPVGAVVQCATHANHVWTYDFLKDSTERGGGVRILTVVDEYTRECLAIEVARSIKARTVVEVLKWLALTRGTPEYIRSDNGPEFIAHEVGAWLEQAGCQTIFITPGSPWENPYIESFNGKFRDECLNCEVFMNLAEARTMIEAWREEYNTERPHSSLGYLTPDEFARRSAEGGGEAARCVGSGRATPSLRPHSGTATSLSL